MILYFDTSALVKKYVLESGSGRVIDLLNSGHAAATSILAYPELIAGVGQKRRHAGISEKDFRAALASFEKDWAAFFIVEFPYPRLQGALLLAQAINFAGKSFTAGS